MDDDWNDDDDDTEAPVTGHDVHFLSRINERVDYEQADLALRLYRDSALVASILADEAPGDAPRVAVALAAGPAAPHVIVERGGRFVTCLAAGMLLSDTPTVPHERLTIHLHRAALRAERDARVHEVTGGDLSVVKRLMLRVRDAGSRLTREEVAQLAIVAPLVEEVFCGCYIRNMLWLVTHAPAVLRMKRLSPSFEPRLRLFWNHFYAAGHYLVLSATRGRESFATWEKPHEALAKIDVWGIWYLKNGTSLGQAFVMLRTWWTLGRAGALAVPRLKQILASAPTITEWSLTAFALLAIARRHSKLRAELIRAVGPARLPKDMQSEEYPVLIARQLQWLMAVEWGEDHEPPEVHERCRRDLAEEAVAVFERGLEPGRRAGDHLSIARLAHLSINLWDPSCNLPSLASAVALIATARPEELYYPAANIDEAPRFTPEAAFALAKFSPDPLPPVRAAERPGRNDPCTCGSGKKWKRCCGFQ